MLADAAEDHGATLVELAQISQPLLERPELRVIERSGYLLAIAGDEGNGRPTIKQRDSGGNLFIADAESFGDALANRLHKTLHARQIARARTVR